MLGVYFDRSYGYMIDRTYAVRIAHTEDVPSLFYVPSFNEEVEDEVCAEFPYQNLKKKPNKYHYLFLGDSIEEHRLDSLFFVDVLRTFVFSKTDLKNLTETIQKKRDRDRAWIEFHISDHVEASLYHKEKKVGTIVEEGMKEKGCLNEEDVVCIKVNANVIFHAMHLFSLTRCIHFSISHDRIILTDEPENPKIEAIISLPKTQ